MNRTHSQTNDPLMGESRPTIAAASSLYLLTLLLVAVGGTLIQMVSVPWGLAATEIFLIFLPAYLYLRRRKLPVAETVRWRWPGWKVATLTVLIGLSLYQFVTWLSVMLMTLMGYSEQVYAGIVPTTILDALILFVGMAILAPLCEEFLFRGVIQRGYEKRGIGFAIGLVAVLFAAYHLSFLRFLGILLFALVICWMYWRSDSLVTSVLLHFSYNLLAPIIMLISLIWPDAPLDWMGTLPVALLGLGVGVALLLVFQRITAAPVPLRERAPFGLKQAWPLIPAALIILMMAAAEMYVARNPDLLVTQPLELTTPDWSQDSAWQYEIRNQADETIGEATCQRSLQRSLEGGAYQLECLFDHQKAYELQNGSSYFKDGIHQEQLLIRWDAASLDLLAWHSDLQGDGFRVLASVNENDLALNVLVNQTPEAPLTLSPDTLLPGEWPWRLAALAFEDGLAFQVTLAYPSKWSPDAQRSLPQTETHVLRVNGKETLTTPVGDFETWKVNLNDETAWYAVEAPHTLVQYDNGMSVYVLILP